MHAQAMTAPRTNGEDMKTFTVKQTCQEGFDVEPSGGYCYVPLGESGRGRQLTRVPLGSALTDALGEARRVGRCSVMRTNEQGTLLLVEERDANDRRALVIIRDQSGFRGSWELAGRVEPCARPTDGPGYCPACFQYLGVAENPAGHRDVSIPVPQGTILAQGACAQGDAGRMGGGPEMLLLLQPGQEVVIRRSGRLYGAPSCILVRWDGDRLSLETPEERAAREAIHADGEVL
jgi:hypothetical protein